MAQNIIADTCYWLALLDESEENFEAAHIIELLLKEHEIIVPWPCMYEAVSTRLTRPKSRHLLLHFEEIIRRNNVHLQDDSPYRNKALEDVFEFSHKGGKTYSLSDCIIRHLLNDATIRIDTLVTFNTGDFADICALRGIDLFDGS